MAKDKLGTKRICPETGKKFYDLGRDPIVSPYTGISYPLSAFDVTKKKGAKPAEEGEAPAENEEDETEAAEDTGDVEVVSLEDAEPESTSDDDDDDEENEEVIPDIDTTDIDDEVGDDDDDTFLEDDEDDEPAVGVITNRDEDDS